MKTVDKLLYIGLAGIAIGIGLKIANKKGIIKW